MNYGFVKIAAAVPEVRVASPEWNVERIEALTVQAEGKGAEVIVFPELSLTGYTCQDLFHQQTLLEETERALSKLQEFSHGLDIIIVVGMPVQVKGGLINAAVVMQHGRIEAVVAKTFLPNYKEFYEKRWFISSADITPGTAIWLGGQQIELQRAWLFETSAMTFGIEICEDLWAPVPPSCRLALEGAEVILNLSADNECVGKYRYVKQLVQQQSASTISGYVYVGAGFGESTQDVVFGSKVLVAENGSIIAEGRHNSLEEQLVITEIDIERLRNERRQNTTFATCAAKETAEGTKRVVLHTEPGDFSLTRSICPHPFVPQGAELDERCEEIFSIQTQGLAKRMRHTHAQTAIVGISGGLDSTLALLVTVRTFDLLGLDRKGIICITMPGFGTTDRTYHNAMDLMKQLGITIREISIKAACEQHFRDISHDIAKHDVTYENSQARERTQILMDFSNKVNGLVLGTGDLSELALGWATYNGDHMSMYNVNVSIPKTLVRHLVRWFASSLDDGTKKGKAIRATLLDVLDTPISPELTPAAKDGTILQVTEDIVGPYELHDFFLYNMLRYGYTPAKLYLLARKAFKGEYDNATIKKWLRTFIRRFFAQQFKRSCLPDGPKVGSVSLSPRGDWRMPSDASSRLWLAQCDTLPE